MKTAQHSLRALHETLTGTCSSPAQPQHFMCVLKHIHVHNVSFLHFKWMKKSTFEPWRAQFDFLTQLIATDYFNLTINYIKLKSSPKNFVSFKNLRKLRKHLCFRFKEFFLKPCFLGCRGNRSLLKTNQLLLKSRNICDCEENSDPPCLMKLLHDQTFQDGDVSVHLNQFHQICSCFQIIINFFSVLCSLIIAFGLFVHNCWN